MKDEIIKAARAIRRWMAAKLLKLPPLFEKNVQLQEFY